MLSLEITIFGLKMMVKSGIEFFILKAYMTLQSCCCLVQKNLPREAELAWQISRYTYLKWHVGFQNKKF